MLAKFRQSLNVLVSILFRVEGNLIFSIALPAKTLPLYSISFTTCFSPSFSSPSFNVTLFSCLQSANALAQISFTLTGVVTLSRPLPEKHCFPIFSSESGSLMSFRFWQVQNALYSIIFNVDGRSISCNPLYSKTPCHNLFFL